MQVRVLLSALDDENPNPVPIWDGFGFFVFPYCRKCLKRLLIGALDLSCVAFVKTIRLLDF